MKLPPGTKVVKDSADHSSEDKALSALDTLLPALGYAPRSSMAEDDLHDPDLVVVFEFPEDE